MFDPTMFFADDIASQGIGFLTRGFVAFLILGAMFFTMLLPIFAIPYIFIKMGSVAGKVQASVNRAGRRSARAGIRRGKEAYNDSGFKQARNMRRDARKAERRRRTLEGKGIGGALFNAEGALSTRMPRTAGQKAGDLRMADAIDDAKRKIRAEKIDNTHRNMSGNVASALSEGIRPQDLRTALKADGSARFTSADDLASLDYLERTGQLASPDSTLATAAMRKVLDIENISGHGTTLDTRGGSTVPISPEIQVQNLASMLGEDVEANRQFSEELSSGASKHGYKNLMYGNVTDGKFTNYTEAGKSPKALVDGGLSGVNKDMLDDKNIQDALKNKVAAEGKSAQLQIIQQTMHIDKDASLKTLSESINVDINTLKAVRQSIASNGTIPMPSGFGVAGTTPPDNQGGGSIISGGPEGGLR